MNEHATILDRYRLIERLAAGGSAEVWRGIDLQLDRPVAIKRLHPHLLPDGASRQRLVAEARAAAALSHPAIVGIYDVDATGESPAIVMELVEGESLAARIARDGPLPEREAARIGAELADALFHAHRQGVIHRDVKPGNVLLGADGRVRLADFGIAHSLASTAGRLTLPGTVIGTLSAMAPEQLTDGPITPRTDLYGLGVVLHEALVGRAPFDAGSPVALVEAQRAGAPPMPGVDPALAAAIASCLAHDPADRPLHAGALGEGLRAWLHGDARPLAAMAPARPDDETRTAPRVIPAPAVAVASAARPPSNVRRSWLPGIALLAVLLAAVLAGALALGEGTVAEPSVSPTVTPATATPSPEWLADLVAEVAEACGPEAATEAETVMAAMDEKDADDYAKELVDACEDGGGNGGPGNRGGSNRGGGNDD